MPPALEDVETANRSLPNVRGLQKGRNAAISESFA
jgi:hypothetical protein